MDKRATDAITPTWWSYGPEDSVLVAACEKSEQMNEGTAAKRAKCDFLTDTEMMAAYDALMVSQMNVYLTMVN